MPLANSYVLRRHCRRLAFFLPRFACTGPGEMHLHPGAQDPVRSSEHRSAAHSPRILAPRRSPFRHLLPWCSHPSPASPGRSASPRPGLPAASASLPLPFCRSPHGDPQAPAPHALTQDGPLDAGEEHPQYLPREARRLGLTQISWACRPQAR